MKKCNRFFYVPFPGYTKFYGISFGNFCIILLTNKQKGGGNYYIVYQSKRKSFEDYLPEVARHLERTFLEIGCAAEDLSSGELIIIWLTVKLMDGEQELSAPTRQWFMGAMFCSSQPHHQHSVFSVGPGPQIGGGGGRRGGGGGGGGRGGVLALLPVPLSHTDTQPDSDGEEKPMLAEAVSILFH